MMKELLYQGVDWIAMIHEKIIRLNDYYEGSFSDKELHFLVIGLLGLLLIFLIHPLFLHLSKTGHVMVISWIYVFTLILVITFAIEIGQRMSKKGDMEFADIVFGIGGFIVMFAGFALIRGLIRGIARLLRRKKQAAPGLEEAAVPDRRELPAQAPRRVRRTDRFLPDPPSQEPDIAIES